MLASNFVRKPGVVCVSAGVDFILSIWIFASNILFLDVNESHTLHFAKVTAILCIYCANLQSQSFAQECNKTNEMRQNVNKYK